jgi:pyruvate formate lyase activating enzyme
VRFHDGKELRVPWGYVAALNADPVEKKPFYHLLPGSIALTFGMLGCDFHCGYCQNWLSSQALRDPASDETAYFVKRISPEQIVETARRAGADVIASSYNEPLITSEWAAAVFKQAVAAGIKCAYVSNGNATPEVLEYLRPYLTGMKIDLKSMQDKNYRQLGGVLKNVLDTIKRVKEMGLWLEVCTLVVPGFNDSVDELWEAARFLSSVSADIPWHVTAFHSDYKMQDTPNTPAKTLLRAAEIGREAGLHYVYAGNLPGRVDEYETTFCPQCNTALVERTGYSIRAMRVTMRGTCPQCGTAVAGVWPEIREGAV